MHLKQKKYLNYLLENNLNKQRVSLIFPYIIIFNYSLNALNYSNNYNHNIIILVL